MSHIKDRLSSYHDWMQDIVNRYKLVTARDFLEMLEQLQDDLEQDEKENGWIPVGERLPETDDYILLSFTNYSIPLVGRCERDKDGSGIFYTGDDLISCLGNDLFVNAWMELPERYKGDERAWEDVN
nr:MAG TPA: Protein of unknown function (DUF551) [Caudoviricetes sp.]